MTLFTTLTVLSYVLPRCWLHSFINGAVTRTQVTTPGSVLFILLFTTTVTTKNSNIYLCRTVQSTSAIMCYRQGEYYCPFQIRKHCLKIMAGSRKEAVETLSHTHWSLEELSPRDYTSSTGSSSPSQRIRKSPSEPFELVSWDEVTSAWGPFPRCSSYYLILANVIMSW